MTWKNLTADADALRQTLGFDEWAVLGQAILADRLPNARLDIIERAGHNPQDERPKEVLDAIRRFLTTAHDFSKQFGDAGRPETTTI
jgi:hypothetical protein